MIKKIIFAVTCTAILVPAAFATDQEECFGLNDYFNKSPDEIHARINEYETKLAAGNDDNYANLAIAILYAALSSPEENPEKGASAMIVEYSKRFEKNEKNNPLAMTYYGLGCSLVSRDSKNPVTQITQVKKAISLFDKAVDLASADNRLWYVRYIRANFYINLPDTFKKRSIAEKDFEFVENYYTSHPEIEGFMCNGCYNLGEIEKSRGNIDKAVKYWTLSVELDKKLHLNSKEAQKAAKRLKLFEN
ncbi:MAG: hypothetical protein M0P01_02915 [Treponema sp.]|nr:hypothetical protein [Treponema sp.]